MIAIVVSSDAEHQPDRRHDQGPDREAGGDRARGPAVQRVRAAGHQRHADAGEHGEEGGRAAAGDRLHQRHPAVGGGRHQGVRRDHPHQGEAPRDVQPDDPARRDHAASHGVHPRLTRITRSPEPLLVVIHSDPSGAGSTVRIRPKVPSKKRRMRRLPAPVRSTR